jgi:hypothetical protein
MRCRKKNTNIHCCVSSATMVTRTRHNVTFTSTAYLVLTQYEAVNISQRLTRDKQRNCNVRNGKYTEPSPDHKRYFHSVRDLTD